MLGRTAKSEVAQVIDHILGADNSIVPINNLALHLLNTAKRTLTEPDDIEVSHMKIRCKPNIVQ